RPRSGLQLDAQTGVLERIAREGRVKIQDVTWSVDSRFTIAAGRYVAGSDSLAVHEHHTAADRHRSAVLPLRGDPAWRQRRSEELESGGGSEGHLTVAGLGDVRGRGAVLSVLVADRDR